MDDKMYVRALKLTDDPHSCKIVYDKGGSLYMRTGEDGFKVGKRLQAPLSTITNKWGFYPVSNTPWFRDAEELVDNLNKFDVGQDGKLYYNG